MTKIYSFLIVAIVFASNVMAQNIPSYVPKDGLVGWWPFNGNANDESGNGNHGTVTGATLTADRNGVANKAYNFDVSHWSWGSGGDIIFIPYNSSFNTDKISVSVWVKRTTNGTQNQGLTILNRYQYGYSSPNGQTWGIGVDQNSSFNIKTAVIQASNANDQAVIENVGPVMNINLWYQIIFTFDGVDLKQYVNGVLTDIDQKSGFTLNKLGNSGISIGVSDQANGRWGPFGGQIDDIAIYNRALSQQEISALYTGTSQAGLASTKVFVDAPATVNQNETLNNCPLDSAAKT